LRFTEIRDRRKGCAVSLIKAGLKVIGRDPGPVRPPLTNPADAELATLASVIETGRSLATGA
jgi:5-dehydro-4-deoxyglucarate dehydratase